MKQTLLLIVVLLTLVQLCQGNYGRGNQHQKKRIDPYKTLNLKKDAKPKEIKKAYRTLSMKYHPDKNKSPQAKEKMTQINEAFEMISDPDAKDIYDEFGATEKYYDRFSYMQSRRGKELAKKDFFSHSEDVVTMEMKTFYQNVRKKPHLVEFYAPWCVHCQEMVPKFKKAAVLLEGIVQLGAVNCEKHGDLCQQQGIHSYPSLMFFHPAERGQSQEVEKFDGGHDPEDIYSWVKQSLSNDLIQLNRDEYNKQVVDSEHLWVIDFSAGSWCGPCAMLKPHLRRFAGNLKGIVKVGIVQCDHEKDLCNELNVNFYPQLKVFKKDKTPTEGESLSSQEQNLNPAMSVLNMFEKVVKILYEPPATPPTPDTDTTDDEPRELDDDEIIDDVPIEDDDNSDAGKQEL